MSKGVPVKQVKTRKHMPEAPASKQTDRPSFAIGGSTAETHPGLGPGVCVNSFDGALMRSLSGPRLMGKLSILGRRGSGIIPEQV
jgi:hypothetical protein